MQQGTGRAPLRAVLAVAGVLATLVAAPGSALGHGDKGEAYVPWADGITEQRSVQAFRSPDSSATAALQEDSVDTLGTSGLFLTGNSDKDGVVNSDLAFWRSYAYAGNYGGFRILDARSDEMKTLVDFPCNGPQNDVSIAKLKGRMYLFQSIDTPQTAEDCDSANSPLIGGTNRVGYEGIRVFDVTNPRKPRFLDMIQTACGSHTHTLIQRGGIVYLYISSYPLGSNITPDGAEGPGDFRPCVTPHKKISIIKLQRESGRRATGLDFEIKEQPLSDDTAEPPNRPFQACHDIQVFEPRNLAVGSCGGDAQIWDISDPWDPTTNVEGRHTHIYSPSAADTFEFIHSAFVTWDGKYVGIMDETGGGGTANCFAEETTDGYYYFYPLVAPGDPEPELVSRYMIPRNQGTEICVSHNANVVPVKDRYVMTAAYYQGGVSVVDFTDVTNPTEIAYSDLEDPIGSSDEWSTYWYNGRIFSNSGLNRRGATGNRGLDLYRPAASLGLRGAKKWSYSNPQTQERRQVP